MVVVRVCILLNLQIYSNDSAFTFPVSLPPCLIVLRYISILSAIHTHFGLRRIYTHIQQLCEMGRDAESDPPYFGEVVNQSENP